MALGKTTRPVTMRKGSAKRSAPKRDDDAKLKELVPRGMANSFVKSKLHEKALEVAGLGAPENWEGSMPELPNDMGTVDHDELSTLLAQFTNAHSTALWNASKAYVEADAYEEIAEYLENIALMDADGTNDTQRKAQARTSEDVVLARSLQKARYHDYVRFRDEAKTLENRAKAISRIGGFVGDEAEGEDLRAGKSSSRGKASGSDKGTSRGSGRARSRR